MNGSPADARGSRWAPWLNLVLPGGGLILIGSLWSGLLVGVLFACCADFALAAALLFPDDFAAATGRFPVPPRLWGIVLAAGSYVVAQWWLVRALRRQRTRCAAAERARCLRAVQELLACGQAAQALRILLPLAQQARHDLLIAYRLAQVLSAVGDVPAARAAWQQVRVLDRDGIYRAQVQQAVSELRLSSL